MRSLSILLLLASFTCAAAPSIGCAATVDDRTDPNALASHLVDLTVPSEVIRRGATKAYTDNFRASFLRNPKAQAAIERMPGLLDTMSDAAATEVSKAITPLLLSIKTRLSALYSSNLTLIELAQAVDFYTQPAGKKLVEEIPFIAAGGDVRRILTSSELSSFEAYLRSSGGKKMAQLAPQQWNAVTSDVNRALAAAQPKIETAAMQAGQAYMRSHPPVSR